MAGLEYLLCPCARLDAGLHPGLDPEVGSSLDDSYSVTQSPPGNYCYVKWWDGGPILRASTKARNEIESRKWRQRALLPCFCLSLYFGTPNSSLFRIFGGLAVFCQRGLKIQAMRGRSPCCGLVKRSHGRLSNRC